MSSVVIISLPLLVQLGTCLYMTVILTVFFASILSGDLTEGVNEGLSTLMVNSIGSKKGFLKSIGGGLRVVILKGPLGWGTRLWPTRMQEYSPPSGWLTLNTALDSTMVLGSNFRFTATSTPSLPSHPPALRFTC